MGTGASKSGPNAWFPGERLCYEGNSAARERGQQLSDARTVDPAQSSECKLGITRGVMKPVLRWLAGIVAVIIQPFGYFSRPTHPESSDVATEKHADGVVEEAQAVVTAIEDAVVRPTTVKSFTSPVTADVIVDPDVNLAAHIVLDDQEIRRRRDLVRTFFNDFWTGAYEKPAAFVERLDQAEDYVNERLAASGEFWQLDAKTRTMLGLPPRANSRNSGKNGAARD